MTPFASRAAPHFRSPRNAGDAGRAARLRSRRRLPIVPVFGPAVVVALAAVAVLWLAPAAFAQLSFTGPTNFAAGDFPVGVAVGDFDGDGDPDLGVANARSDDVSVLLNTTPRPTSISSVSGSGTYGGEATLQATLKSGTTALAGRSTSFELNGVSVGSVVTNASGMPS